MKLHNNYPNEVLIDMAGLLAYDNKLVEKIKEEETGYDEVLQDEDVDLALYMANKFLNEYEQDDTVSPLQNQRDFFNANKEKIIRDYYNDSLEPIKYKDQDLLKFSKENPYLTVGNIRISNYDDNTPILAARNDYGEYFPYRNAEEVDCIIEGVDTNIESVIVPSFHEDYKDDGRPLIKGLIFDFE